jgi:hypothetical protein
MPTGLIDHQILWLSPDLTHVHPQIVVYFGGDMVNLGLQGTEASTSEAFFIGAADSAGNARCIGILEEQDSDSTETATTSQADKWIGTRDYDSGVVRDHTIMLDDATWTWHGWWEFPYQSYVGIEDSTVVETPAAASTAVFWGIQKDPEPGRGDTRPSQDIL